MLTKIFKFNQFLINLIQSNSIQSTLTEGKIIFDWILEGLQLQQKNYLCRI